MANGSVLGVHTVYGTLENDTCIHIHFKKERKNTSTSIRQPRNSDRDSSPINGLSVLRIDDHETSKDQG